MVSAFSPFASIKVKKILRKSQLQFQEKLGKLRLRRKSGFLIKEKRVAECSKAQSYVAQSIFIKRIGHNVA